MITAGEKEGICTLVFFVAIFMASFQWALASQARDDARNATSSSLTRAGSDIFIVPVEARGCDQWEEPAEANHTTCVIRRQEANLWKRRRSGKDSPWQSPLINQLQMSTNLKSLLAVLLPTRHPEVEELDVGMGDLHLLQQTITLHSAAHKVIRYEWPTWVLSVTVGVMALLILMAMLLTLHLSSSSKSASDMLVQSYSKKSTTSEKEVSTDEFPRNEHTQASTSTLRLGGSSASSKKDSLDLVDVVIVEGKEVRLGKGSWAEAYRYAETQDKKRALRFMFRTQIISVREMEDDLTVATSEHINKSVGIVRTMLQQRHEKYWLNNTEAAQQFFEEQLMTVLHLSMPR